MKGIRYSDGLISAVCAYVFPSLSQCTVPLTLILVENIIFLQLILPQELLCSFCFLLEHLSIQVGYFFNRAVVFIRETKAYLKVTVHLLLLLEYMHFLSNDRICGEDVPQGEIVSVSNTMTIVFKSDNNITLGGFVASYRTVDVVPDLESVALVEGSQRSACEDTTNQDEGFIQSPNYPGNYPKRTTCSYDITAPEGSHVQVDFEPAFEIRYKPDCRKNFLMIDLGNGITENLK